MTIEEIIRNYEQVEWRGGVYHTIRHPDGFKFLADAADAERIAEADAEGLKRSEEAAARFQAGEITNLEALDELAAASRAYGRKVRKIHREIREREN